MYTSFCAPSERGSRSLAAPSKNKTKKSFEPMLASTADMFPPPVYDSVLYIG